MYAFHITKSSAEGRKPVLFVSSYPTFLNVWSFAARFLCTDYTQHLTVSEMKEFIQKVCARKFGKVPFKSVRLQKNLGQN
jgi:hypothetical protein